MVFKSLLVKFREREEGVTALEYALIAALIAVVIIAGATLAGQSANNTLNNVGQKMQAAGQ
ncbi:MAG: Flp family type IVb pilin [Myxococcales bacterium]